MGLLEPILTIVEEGGVQPVYLCLSTPWSMFAKMRYSEDEDHLLAYSGPSFVAEVRKKKKIV